MIPKIQQTIIPSVGYLILFLLIFLLVISSLSRIKSDLKFLGERKVDVNSIPFFSMFILSIISLCALFLPLIEIPIIGGISYFEIIFDSEDSLIFLTPLFIIMLFSLIYNGIISFRKISFKDARSENMDTLISFSVLLIVSLVLVEILNMLHPVETDNVVAMKIIEQYRIGSGMYALIFLSSLQLLIAIISNSFSSKAKILD
ncbi:MAG: hypothetical protein RL331_1864 [Bacteroidota bacterium]|jgi:hypothetical protein